MESASRDVGRVNVFLEPLNQFPRRLVGERKGQNALGFDAIFGEMQNLLSDHPGLAGTGSSYDELDTVFFDSFLLRRVKEHKKHSERGRRMLKSCHSIISLLCIGLNFVLSNLPQIFESNILGSALICYMKAFNKNY